MTSLPFTLAFDLGLTKIFFSDNVTSRSPFETNALTCVSASAPVICSLLESNAERFYFGNVDNGSVA